MTDPDTAAFFAGHDAALPLYERLETLLFTRFAGVEKRVRKTQISFACGCVFACVSFARVKRKAELPEGYVTLTLGLPAPLESPRAAVQTEAYPGRWTCHLVLSRAEELDGELLGWIGLAYDFAGRKRKR